LRSPLPRSGNHCVKQVDLHLHCARLGGIPRRVQGSLTG
jgi:hypothetical protein